MASVDLLDGIDAVLGARWPQDKSERDPEKFGITIFAAAVKKVRRNNLFWGLILWALEHYLER